MAVLKNDWLKKGEKICAGEKLFSIFALPKAEVAQLVEHNLAKVRVAGSSPVFRSFPGKPGFFIKRRSKKLFIVIVHARMVELVDTLDLKSNGHRGRAGSSPAPGTPSKQLFH